ncbi:DUF6538 domain-containing protein [Pseudooceanicola nanhaiensis]|uniref:Integrase n=1 Tax=Pseudooceanicola nanhaiensis TaxID=375761 RepID=A0A917SIF6_9RHOB|nr:DUF6538 domain-containing protein [Pseudooceanicola nanhaiensis]GGL82290.1 integrase [Pseudooceanicola nanhaiensis]
MKNLWLRGNTYWFRMRRPDRYASVYSGSHVNQSLKTDSRAEALALAPVVKRQWLAELDARLAQVAPASSREAFQATLAVAKAHGRGFTDAQALADGPLPQLLEALTYAQASDPEAKSAVFAAALGGFDLPGTTITELSVDMPRLLISETLAKNDRQLREWKNRYIRASDAFVAAVGDKPVKDVTVQDIFAVRRLWRKRVEEKAVATGYANKHLGYLEAMIDAFYSDLEIDLFENPCQGIRIDDKQPWEKKSARSSKKEFKPSWIRETILSPGKTDRLNDEARDILIVMAETGCRASEVYDSPASAIHLDHEIPHLAIEVEMPSPGDKAGHRRDVKTGSSIRKVPLVGAALEAVQRHPDGFPRYRGNANFSNAVMKFFKDNELLPSPDHKISSLRHSYESRMRRLNIDNEERGQLMGHSLKRIRGREVYGDETELKLRALFAEMIAFPTQTWAPRSFQTLNQEISRILEEEGFKLPGSS